MNITVQTQDRDELCRRRFESRQRDFLKMLVTPAIIEEHRRSPLGQHSEPLERLLIYFNRRPLAGRYAIMTVVPFRSYRIVVLSGERGARPKALDDMKFRTHAEALHAVFLRYLQDLVES